MDKTAAPVRDPAGISIDGRVLYCFGQWTVRYLQDLEKSQARLRLPGSADITLDMAGVASIDSGGAWLLLRIVERFEKDGAKVTIASLTPHAAELLDLLKQTGFTRDKLPQLKSAPLLARIGRSAHEGTTYALNMLAFIGAIGRVFLRQLIRPGRIRWRQISDSLAEAGYKALGIVGLLSFLLGIVIAYQGGIQLRQYGASLFIADLVGLSMVRELAPLITAIIIAGRTGSAYTAQIGTMKVTEELDAWRSMGIDPLELLVLPKLLALIIAMPLLTVYADIMGVLGGMVMANSQLDLSFSTYLQRIGEAITLNSYMIGIGKTPVFAAIVATIGCYQGFQVSGSAESVGRRTTVSVVQSIFAVIVVDAIFSVAFSYLGM